MLMIIALLVRTGLRGKVTLLTLGLTALGQGG